MMFSTPLPPSSSPPTVAAVVVVFHPDLERLQQTLRSLEGQVDWLIVVDNTPPDSDVPSRAGLPGEWLFLGENLGIGAAQNAGIERAMTHGASHVMLSDQDSIYPPGAVQTLMTALLKLEAQGEPVAAVGPSFRNPHIPDQQDAVFIWQPGAKAIKRRIPAGVIRASYLIASGCLMSVSALQRIGLMDETLFIDWVDTEWCLRAGRAGYSVWGCADVRIDHALGDDSKPFLGRRIVVHSPRRHYYMVRNGLLLALRASPLNLRQRAWALLRVLAFVGVFPWLAKPHAAHLAACLRGVLHGLAGRRGPA